MDVAKIKRKLAFLAQYLDELREFGSITLEEYLDDLVRRRAIERLIQLIMECATDINHEMIFAAGMRAVDNSYGTFLKLPSLGMLKEREAKQFASLAGLRNRIVHEYDVLDDETVYNNISRIQKLFPLYVKAVNQKVAAEDADRS